MVGCVRGDGVGVVVDARDYFGALAAVDACPLDTGGRATGAAKEVDVVKSYWVLFHDSIVMISFGTPPRAPCRHFNSFVSLLLAHFTFRTQRTENPWAQRGPDSGCTPLE